MTQAEPMIGASLRHVRRRRGLTRRVVTYPGLAARDEFLTDGSDGRLQVILSVVEPGGGTGPEAYSHDSDEECLIVLEGNLRLWVGGEQHDLEAGGGSRDFG